MTSSDKPQRHQALWTPAEESLLYDQTVAGVDADLIQDAHRRTRYSIIKRQKKLGLRDERSALAAPFVSIDDLPFTYVPRWLRGPLELPTANGPDSDGHRRRKKMKDKSEALLSAVLNNAVWPDADAATRDDLFPTTACRTVRGEKSFFSEKLQRQVMCESIAERTVLTALERHPLVTSYTEQPLAIPYQFRGQRKLYYPDIFAQIGSVRIVIEVKGFNSLAAYTTLIKGRAAINHLSGHGIGYALSDYKGVGLRHILRTQIDAEIEETLLALLDQYEVLQGDDFAEHFHIEPDFKWQLQAIALKHHLHMKHDMQMKTARFEVRRLSDHEDRSVFVSKLCPHASNTVNRTGVSF